MVHLLLKSNALVQSETYYRVKLNKTTKNMFYIKINVVQ